MPIKLEVDMEAFIETVQHNDEPLGFGDLVFAWDKDTTMFVVGVHCGYDNYYDPDTGERVKHRHKIFVLSWSDQVATVFDNALSIPSYSKLRQVITKFGTGRIDHFKDANNKVCVVLDNLDNVELDVNEVKPFDWERIKGAYTKNDKPTA